MRRLIIFALTALLAVPAFAEEVELITGEVLTGTVSKRSHAGLMLDHPVLGRLWISGENVAGVDGGPLVDPVAAAVTDLTNRPPLPVLTAKSTDPSRPEQKGSSALAASLHAQRPLEATRLPDPGRRGAGR